MWTEGLLLLDTPGILWPKFDDPEVGMRLAYTGAVKDDVMDTETLALPSDGAAGAGISRGAHRALQD